MWNLTVSVCVPLATTVGVLWSVSTSNRAGWLMLATWSGLPLPGGQPDPRFLPITAVGPDWATSLPAELVAVTRKRIVVLTSPEVSAYVFLFAPLIVAHEPPLVSHRNQAYAYFDGLFVQVPLLPLRVEPSCGVPEMTGTAVFVGLPAATTTAVAAEVAVVDPSLFLATTWK